MEHTTTEGRIYNVCTGRSTTILELAGAVADILGVTPILLSRRRDQGDIWLSCGDPSEARAALGFQADTSLASGLVKTLLTPFMPQAASPGSTDYRFEAPTNGELGQLPIGLLHGSKVSMGSSCKTKQGVYKRLIWASQTSVDRKAGVSDFPGFHRFCFSWRRT